MIRDYVIMAIWITRHSMERQNMAEAIRSAEGYKTLVRSGRLVQADQC